MPFDVTDAEFETRVINRSREIPVVVDLWAPWCGPCRQLAPLLEKLEQERSGEFELVKINIDENPKVANALRAQSIPLVIGFRDGKIAGQFVGVQSPAAIREFLDQLIPTELERLVIAAGKSLEIGDVSSAEASLAKAESIDPTHDAVRFCRAGMHMANSGSSGYSL